MRENRKLRLSREAMTELDDGDLRLVAAGDVISGAPLCEVIVEIVRRSVVATCRCTQGAGCTRICPL